MLTALPVSARVPAPLTPLIGRDGRVETACQALQGTRLLTLTGAGGSGKTRLAIELASRTNPAAWVELATITDPRHVGEHVAATLGLSDRGGRPSLAHVVERYAATDMLLVLDNCEHLVDAAADVIGQLLRTCPRMRVLATSREALGVCGERTLAVPPLSLPNEDSFEAVANADAIALFVERAQDVRAGFELTPRNAPAVARICRRLDGIPLAIELAAARVRALDPEQLAARLESSIGLLETGSRGALPRHRTIRATLDWSHRLLSNEERALLHRLSVFAGAFSLDAVEAVCSDRHQRSGEVLDRVTGLLDKSLLLYEPGESGTRYRMLETVREYAAEHLAAAGETDAVRDRHARFFVNLAERAAPTIFGGIGDETWIARLDDEAANFRDAHDWCEQQTSRLELSLRLSVALHWYWFVRGRFNEGRLRVGIALTFAEGIEPVLRGRALTVLGRLALWQGDYGSVYAPMRDAADLLRRHGDRASTAYAVHGLAIASALRGERNEGRRLLDEASSLLTADAPGALAAWIEYWRGLIAEWDRDVAAAREAFARAVASGRRLGHKTVTGHALCAAGRLELAAGNTSEAVRTLHEGLALCREIEDRWGTALALQGLARAAARSGEAARAAALLGAADAIREELGVELYPAASEYRSATIAEAVTASGEPAFWAAWTDGRQRRLDTLVAEAAPAAAQAVRSDVTDATSLPSPRVFIRALGGFEAIVDGRRIERPEWGSSRARELLAFLACHPDGCTKSEIGLALWPDASPAQLRNSFHVTLHRLRHALGDPEIVQVDGERYRFNPSVACEFDVRRFESDARAAVRALRRSSGAARAEAAGTPDPVVMLESAVVRYRGDFLSGERVGEWADGYRDRLRQLHLEALDALGRAQMERRRYVEAADAFRALLSADPLNEDACRLQMICLVELHDRAGALRAYDALARALREELGVRPQRETSNLRDKLVSTT